MPPRYNVITQNNNKVLNDLKKLDGFASELENVIGNGSVSDGITASDIANYLLQLGVKTRQHDVDIADRVSKSALAENGLLNTVNKTIGGSSNEIGDAELAQYLKRNTEIVNEHTYYLDNSAVSKEKFRSLTAGFTEFKKVEFNLPVTPAPNTTIFTPPPVNSGYIQVRNKDSITVNALVSMFNKGVINNSWNVNFINAPDDNGFVRNVNNTLTGMDSMATPNSTRHLMCVKPESNFTLKMSFMVNNADDFSDFFMYSILANPDETGAPFSAKVLDVNSVMSNQSYVSKTLDDPRNTLFDGSANVFYNLKINKTGNSIVFTITTEDGIYVGSGSDTVSSNGIKWGLLNNKNVSVKSIVMDGVTWYIGNGEDLSNDFGAYKIQAGIDNNDFIVLYYVNEGSFFEVINISGSLIQSKLKSQLGSSSDIQTPGDLQFVYAWSDVKQHLIYDINGLRNRSDGLLLGNDEYDLTTEINNIQKTNDNDKHVVQSLAHYQENGNTVVLVQGVTETFDVNGNILQGINAVFVVKIEIDGTTKELVTTPTVTRTVVTLPQSYSFGDNRIQTIIEQSPRNDPSIETDLFDKDTFFHVIIGAKEVLSHTTDGVDHYKLETHIFILFNGNLVATIPVKDKLGTKPIDRSYYKGSPPTDDNPWDYEIFNYYGVILLGSQIVHTEDTEPKTYLYLCYAADAVGPPFSETVRSGTYQKLCRIDMDAVLASSAASSAPVELNIGDSTISYFTEDPSLVREPKDYISPVSSYPYGQHINISSKAMVNVNRQYYFMRKMSIYELDLDNLYFKSRVDYESGINEDRRSGDDWMKRMVPYRVAISQDYLNVIAGGNHLYSINLESSFSKGRAAQMNEHLPPLEYIPEVDDADFQLTEQRVSTLDPLPVPFLYSYDNIIPLDDANNTSLASAKSISVTLNGVLTVDSEVYNYDYASQIYRSASNPNNYYTVIDETGNSFSWNTAIILDGFPVVLASPSLGGQKWLGFKTFDPQWEYHAYALDTSLTDVLRDYWPDYSHETDVVPGYPNLVYMGLGIALKHANFWGPKILGETSEGWTYGWGVVEIAKLDPPPS